MDPPWALRIVALVMCVVIVARMLGARRGKDYFIRRIPGVDALEETVGRATETGRPVVFSPGIGAFDNMQTIAGLAVLAWVAKRCVQMGVRIFVPIAEPVVISAAGDILHEAFRSEGREEEYRSTDVVFFGRDENAYAAGVIGLLTREQAAAAYYFGGFGFESLLMAETGNRVGAIQVGATADFFQIPFFLCACDYTLIGEELYAASAYLSRDPIQVGAVSGQDFCKAILLSIILAGSIASTYMMLSGSSPWTLNPVEGLLGR
ncbi:MAG: DUF6754 domain-containing protein [Fimbriimonadales bacterium]